MTYGKAGRLDESWLPVLGPELESEYMAQLKQYLVKERAAHTVYPPSALWFNAFNLTPFDKVKVVVLGQDPYHGAGQAHGLAFSVTAGIKIPPSLHNIYKELKDDLGISIPSHGDLTGWAKQGVLLLNTCLTVRAHQAYSHRGRGWEQFTDKVITALNAEERGIVFVLWGAAARKKSAMIDTPHNFILKSPHPSPLSAYRGFFGSKPFSSVNTILRSLNVEPIDWTLPREATLQ